MTRPQDVDLVIQARWIAPVEPGGVLDDHALVVDAGRIVAVVPSADAELSYRPRTRVARSSHLLIPGLVNAHTHAAMNLLRGIADDVPLKPWLEEHIWPREGRFVSPEFVHDGTALAAAEMLRGGVTCASDMYFFPSDAARAYEAAGLRALVGMPVLDFPTPYAADPDAYLQKGLAARDEHKGSALVAFALAPHAPYTVGDATWAKVAMYAAQLDLPIHTHVAETRGEVDAARRATGETPVTRLERLGVTGPSLIAVHAVHLSAEDIDVLASRRCRVVHCPTSNMKLASGIAPVPALLARGIDVALGTDSAASNNRLDLLAEMRHASLLAKVATGDASTLPAATVLRMATLGGATALGMEAQLGSLAPGKAADVVAVDLGAPDLQPVYEPVSHLANVAGREAVSDVWIGGRRVVEDFRLTTVDDDAQIARAALWQQRLASRSA